jgi:hypothetical protein
MKSFRPTLHLAAIALALMTAATHAAAADVEITRTIASGDIDSEAVIENTTARTTTANLSARSAVVFEMAIVAARDASALHLPAAEVVSATAARGQPRKRPTRWFVSITGQAVQAPPDYRALAGAQRHRRDLPRRLRLVEVADRATLHAV